MSEFGEQILGPTYPYYKNVKTYHQLIHLLVPNHTIYPYFVDGIYFSLNLLLLYPSFFVSVLYNYM